VCLKYVACVSVVSVYARNCVCVIVCLCMCCVPFFLCVCVCYCECVSLWFIPCKRVCVFASEFVLFLNMWCLYVLCSFNWVFVYVYDEYR